MGECNAHLAYTTSSSLLSASENCIEMNDSEFESESLFLCTLYIDRDMTYSSLNIWTLTQLSPFWLFRPPKWTQKETLKMCFQL